MRPTHSYTKLELHNRSAHVNRCGRPEPWPIRHDLNHDQPLRLVPGPLETAGASSRSPPA